MWWLHGEVFIWKLFQSYSQPYLILTYMIHTSSYLLPLSFLPSLSISNSPCPSLLSLSPPLPQTRYFFVPSSHFFLSFPFYFIPFLPPLFPYIPSNTSNLPCLTLYFPLIGILSPIFSPLPTSPPPLVSSWDPTWLPFPPVSPPIRYTFQSISSLSYLLP